MGVRKPSDSSGTPDTSADAPRTTGSGRPLPARSGRRPGDSGTRTQILSAALQLFAAKGYSGTTIRAIADLAQVDPALVHHFFTNKEGVYQAAIGSQLSASSIFDNLQESALEDADAMTQVKWFARAYLSFCENETTRLAMIAIYRGALSDATTSDVYRARVEASNEQVARFLGMPDTEATRSVLAIASAHLLGIAILRYVARVEPLASMDFDDLITWVAPALDSIWARKEADAR
ncbi:TetR/AcrR family transcriptional regulator [Streptomyces sp. NPDC048603]|uniref:TetR/AcrR family transcriptional regulator n=1 Tax=Streptomyces sp. NPDC048603 TaxID=3365577 RepID=UPI003715974D